MSLSRRSPLSEGPTVAQVEARTRIYMYTCWDRDWVWPCIHLHHDNLLQPRLAGELSTIITTTATIKFLKKAAFKHFMIRTGRDVVQWNIWKRTNHVPCLETLQNEIGQPLCIGQSGCQTCPSFRSFNMYKILGVSVLLSFPPAEKLVVGEGEVSKEKCSVLVLKRVPIINVQVTLCFILHNHTPGEKWIQYHSERPCHTLTSLFCAIKSV